jgi:putative dimethyl sulfoxide reductase chaperone
MPTSVQTDARLGHFRRATRWQFLSLLVSPPEEAMLPKLAGLHTELTPDDRQVTAGLMVAVTGDEALVELQDAHHRLLGSVGECPPCESAHQIPGAMGRGSVLADVAGFYKAFQFNPPVTPETPGHIANELAFMAFLELKLAYLIDQPEPEPTDVCRQAAESFLTEHLLLWIPAFCERLVGKAPDSYYGAVAAIVQNWTVANAEALLPELPVAPAPTACAMDTDADETEAGFTCPGRPASESDS